MPTVAVDEIELFYERAGSGSPLLFLGGSGTTVESNRMMLGPFTAAFDVVVHDQRGLGRSTLPAEPYSMDDLADDAVAVLDAVGWASCPVVGVSFGGMVAQQLALRHPGRVERMALLCTSPGGPSTSSFPLHELPDLPRAEREALAPRLLDTRFTPEWLAEHELDRLIAQVMVDRVSDRSPGQVVGERMQMEARAGHDVVDRLGEIRCPTFVGAGRYDGIAPVANAEALAAAVPGAELQVYEGGHAFFAQDARAFPDVLEFLAGGAGRPPAGQLS